MGGVEGVIRGGEGLREALEQIRGQVDSVGRPYFQLFLKTCQGFYCYYFHYHYCYSFLILILVLTHKTKQKKKKKKKKKKKTSEST